MAIHGGLLDYIEFLLLNLAFIFTVFFVYHKFIETKYKINPNKYLMIILSGISIIFCMTFSVEIVEGYIFDMRLVPFIIGVLYGGRKAGPILLAVLLSYRFFIGGEGFMITLVEYLFIYLLLCLMIPAFNRAKKMKHKVRIAVLVSMLDIISFIVLVSVDAFHWDIIDHIPIIPFIVLYVIQIIGSVLIIIFIEKARGENLILSELKRLEKLRIVSDMAASISHEVRNPLTVTRGFLQLLKQKDISQEKKLQYIELSIDELKRAESIISDYLTFAKPSLENVEMLHVQEELEYVINVVNPYATMNNVQTQLSSTPNVYVIGERQKFHQCLINIIKNGIESMPEGGVLSIEHDENAEHTLVSIHDTGVGMSREQIERLGTPYYSTKDSGTGLGTMVVFSIVKAMNGRIEVESELNKGSTFTIILPKAT
ncbi:two-component system, sporulation sensor kinase B [Evansella caseinilytica]|uniref:histidine kinase n=1 Tax=Evansella caseinilytica TaxID=1503961 RepID=A0A1H3HIB4_9BACI|nr:two-component system, sporulation sensor kinase B [Evansella caseinilytica]